MNRNSIKQWSITFPQCGEITRKEFANKFPPYEEVLVSQEEHKNGGFHLHMGIRLKKGIKKTTLLGYVKKKFPDDFKRIDIQPTRSIRNWSDYISKEDAESYSYKDESVLEKKRISLAKEFYRKYKQYYPKLTSWEDTHRMLNIEM